MTRDGKKNNDDAILVSVGRGNSDGKGDGRESKRALDALRRREKCKIDSEILDKHSKYFEAV
jgi:hypothetical protein